MASADRGLLEDCRTALERAANDLDLRSIGAAQDIDQLLERLDQAIEAIDAEEEAASAEWPGYDPMAHE